MDGVCEAVLSAVLGLGVFCVKSIDCWPIRPLCLSRTKAVDKVSVCVCLSIYMTNQRTEN